jgi:GrpB-like predicted nucleotidyltransferase (UPF0157 family)
MTPLDRHTTAAEDLARAGVRDAPVEIVAYDPAWPAAFEAERERLAPLLGAEIHHFGSTAVPGLAAKPVIDMIALVSALDAPVAALVTQAVLARTSPGVTTCTSMTSRPHRRHGVRVSPGRCWSG